MKICLFLAIVIASACNPSRNEEPTGERAATSTGTQKHLIRVGGSTTLSPAMEKAAALFKQSHPDVEISVTHSSSGKGLEELLAGKLDIAGMARKPKLREFQAAKENGMTLKVYQVAYDALAVIVHPSKRDKLTSLSRPQLRAIFFEGTIRDWSQLHPELSGPIAVYIRDLNVSGSAGAFVEHIMGRDDVAFASGGRLVDSTMNLVPTVEKDESGITFSPVNFLSKNVHALAIVDQSGRAVLPTQENIYNLSYGLRRDIFIVTSGEPKGRLSEFIQLLLSDEGQAIMDATGLVSLRR